MKINIKENFNNYTALIKKLLKRFPVTMVLVYIVTIIFTLLSNSDILNNDTVMKVISFLSLWALGTFFAENVFKEKNVGRLIIYAVTALISVLFVNYLFIYKYGNEFLLKLFSCYVITLNLVSLYFLIKRSEKSIPEYFLKVCINNIKVGFLYGVLAAGVAIILYTFSALILEIDSDYILNVEIFFFGFVYITEFINIFIDLDEEVPNFFKVLVKFVLMPLVICAFVIIYLYILKILVLREIPKNQIYRIALGLFIMGGFIWTVMQYFKEEGVMFKISEKLPLAFIPFIFLQIYAIGVRIAGNGLTPLRYFCVMFIIFEIAYILLYLLKKEKLVYLIIIFNAMVIVSVLLPGINMFDMSINNQIKRLDVYKQKTDFTDDEKESIVGAYEYLKTTEKGKTYIDSNYTEIDTTNIYKLDGVYSEYDNYSYNRYDYSDLEHINYNTNDRINVSGFNYISEIKADSYYSNSSKDEKSIEEGLSNVTFKNAKYLYDTNSNTRTIDVNVYKGVKDYLNDLDNYGGMFTIKVDDKTSVVLRKINIEYFRSTEKLYSYSFEGYLLEK